MMDKKVLYLKLTRERLHTAGAIKEHSQVLILAKRWYVREFVCNTRILYYCTEVVPKSNPKLHNLFSSFLLFVFYYCDLDPCWIFPIMMFFCNCNVLCANSKTMPEEGFAWFARNYIGLLINAVWMTSKSLKMLFFMP